MRGDTRAHREPQSQRPFPEREAHTLREDHPAVEVAVREYREEFLSAHACREVAPAGAFLQYRSKYLQHLVAALMAERVIVLLEVVQVEQDDGHRNSPLRLTHGRPEIDLGVSSVRQPGQRVTQREDFDLLPVTPKASCQPTRTHRGESQRGRDTDRERRRSPLRPRTATDAHAAHKE